MHSKFVAAVAISMSLSVPVTAQSAQERFESAQTAFDGEDWAKAAREFSALVDDMSAAQRRGLVGATVLSRLGEAYVRQSETDLAVGPLEEADTIFASAGTTGPDAYATSYFLGPVYEAQGRFEAAAAAYRRALLLSEGAPSIAASAGLARATLFSDPDTARRQLDQLIARAEGADEPNEDELSAYYMLRGRVEMNAGALEAADSWYGKAIDITGSRSRRVSVRDTRVRSEHAYLAFLQGDQKRARERLVFAGANRSDDTPSIPARLGLPSCSPASAVRPEDWMILDLAIREDGSIAGVTPIYSSRPGAIEAEFVSAMRDSYWRQEALDDVDPFWRASLRVEVRCEDLRERRDWSADIMSDMNLPVFEESELRTPREIRAEIVEIELTKSNDSVALLRPLLELREVGGVGERQSDEHRERVDRIAVAANLPDAQRGVLS
ncbi:MAG: hypothetical protein WA906_14250, partial [Pacificimonas sp.]